MIDNTLLFILLHILASLGLVYTFFMVVSRILDTNRFATKWGNFLTYLIVAGLMLGVISLQMLMIRSVVFRFCLHT